MSSLLKVLVVALAVFAGGLSASWAEVPADPAPPPPAAVVVAPLAETSHSINIRGHLLNYEARAGTLSASTGDGASAEIFYVAYGVPLERTPDSTTQRPVTFVFNGGPGAASTYLNLGALGPRIIATSIDGRLSPESSQIIDNPDTWLDATDLVFVDPVGTGYSRAEPEQDERRFWGISADAHSITDFIRRYLDQAGRLSSPIYLVGESYGGFRAVLVARLLQQDARIYPSGVALISPALEFMLVRPDEFDPLHLALGLPSLAAVQYKRAGVDASELKERLHEVEQFALSDYLVALVAGLERGRDLASDRVAQYTGLPIELVRRNFARVSTGLFAKEFARSRGNVLSRYDGAVERTDIAPNRRWIVGPDPVLDASVPVLAAAFETYARQELNYRTNASYRVLNDQISRNWDYGIGPAGQGYAGVMNDLQRVRARNPGMGVLIVNGYTDLVTPYMAARFLVDQVSAIPGARPIRLEVLDGGHMMYFRPASRQALKIAATELYHATQ